MTPFAWGVLVVFCSSVPLLVRFWKDNRHTSLAHAVVWTIIAWIAWILTLPLEPPGSKVGPCVYLALALTGCASIAVLGARRPGVTMWNAVVAALLLMEISPWAEAAIRQSEIQLDGLRLAILAGAIAIGVMNYLPTRAVLGALLVGFGCACQLLRFMKADESGQAELDWLGRCALAAVPGGRSALSNLFTAAESWGVRSLLDGVSRSLRRRLGTTPARAIQSSGPACPLAGAVDVARIACTAWRRTAQSRTEGCHAADAQRADETIWGFKQGMTWRERRFVSPMRKF